MIYGTKYWNDRTRYCVQTNNPTEEQLRKEDGAGWLETCGPTSAINCLGALGYPLEIAYPGGYVPQPEEVLSDYLNDPANYKQFRNVRPNLDPTSIPGGRVPQYYPLGVREVFDAKAEYRDSITRSGVIEVLQARGAVQLCLKDPGHYIAAVAYDALTDELIYHDSWPARVGGDGFCQRMKAAEYSNVKPFAIVYKEA